MPTPTERSDSSTPEDDRRAQAEAPLDADDADENLDAAREDDVDADDDAGREDQAERDTEDAPLDQEDELDEAEEEEDEELEEDDEDDADAAERDAAADKGEDGKDYGKLSKEELSEARADAAKEIYGLDPRNPDQAEAHASALKEYNDVRREEHGRDPRNEGKEYVDKQDVRHEFKYEQSETRAADGTRHEVHRIEGPLYNQDEVINWRKEAVGDSADNKLRKETQKENEAPAHKLDGGHRLYTPTGADPGARENIALQDSGTNRGGGNWHRAEQDVGRVQEGIGPGEKGRVVVEDHFNVDKRGDLVPTNRTIQAYDAQGNPRLADTDVVKYGNFQRQNDPERN